MATGTHALFHLLLDHGAEGEQTLVDRSWYLAHEFEHPPTILENADFPYQLIAELINLGLIRRGRILQGLQCQRVGTNLVRCFALLAGCSFKATHDRRTLGIERIKQAGEA